MSRNTVHPPSLQCSVLHGVVSAGATCGVCVCSMVCGARVCGTVSSVMWCHTRVPTRHGYAARCGIMWCAVVWCGVVSCRVRVYPQEVQRRLLRRLHGREHVLPLTCQGRALPSEAPARQVLHLCDCHNNSCTLRRLVLPLLAHARYRATHAPDWAWGERGESGKSGR